MGSGLGVAVFQSPSQTLLASLILPTYVRT